jgi:hypothetical protein
VSEFIEVDQETHAKLASVGFIEQIWVLTESGNEWLTNYCHQVLSDAHSAEDQIAQCYE